MSIPITIFIPAGARWSVSDLNAQLAAHGFPVQVDPFDPKKDFGYRPCVYDGHRCGFEYFFEPIDVYMESVEEMRECEPDDFPYSEGDIERVQRSAEVVQLVTHSGLRDRTAAVFVASCLAELTGGTLLDEPVWKWYDGEGLVAWARGEVEALVPLIVEYET